MRNRFVKITAGIMAGAIMVSSFQTGVIASPSAGLTNYTSNAMAGSTIPTAGASLAFAESMISNGETAKIASNSTPILKADYADYAVAQVRDYANIRKKADAKSDVVGKLYNNAIAMVVDEKDDWYKIESGSVVGYVKKDFVVVGDAELIEKVGKRVATVTAKTLNVRSEADLEAEVVTSVDKGSCYTVTGEEDDEWIEIATDAGKGFVSTEYVSLGTEYKFAESKEEEEARLAEEAKSSSASELGSVSGSRGQDVISYACQFVGNRYVYGGSSLTNGTDCSGFVMSVYRKYGVSLPHSSSALRSVGTGVGVKDMKPGDIVCFEGHVALYMGNNQIVHAANARKGIIKSDLYYTGKRILAVRRIFK